MKFELIIQDAGSWSGISLDEVKEILALFPGRNYNLITL